MAMTVTPENVSRVESLIKKDQTVTYTEIQDIMKISSGSLALILHDCLGVKKRCTRWVRHKLNEEQKWCRVDWCTHMLRKFDGGISPRVLGHRNRRRNLGIPMRLRDEATVGGVGLPSQESTCEIQKKQKWFQTNYSVFLCKFGHVATIPLEDRKTVTADWYVNHCLPKIFQHAVNTCSNGCPWSTAPSWQRQPAHSSCNSGLSNRQ